MAHIIFLLDNAALNPPQVLRVCPYLSLKEDTNSNKDFIRVKNKGSISHAKDIADSGDGILVFHLFTKQRAQHMRARTHCTSLLSPINSKQMIVRDLETAFFCICTQVASPGLECLLHSPQLGEPACVLAVALLLSVHRNPPEIRS